VRTEGQAKAPGKHMLVFDWQYPEPGLGKGGTGTLKADAKRLSLGPEQLTPAEREMIYGTYRDRQ